MTRSGVPESSDGILETTSGSILNTRMFLIKKGFIYVASRFELNIDKIKSICLVALSPFSSHTYIIGKTGRDWEGGNAHCAALLS